MSVVFTIEETTYHVNKASIYKARDLPLINVEVYKGNARSWQCFSLDPLHVRAQTSYFSLGPNFVNTHCFGLPLQTPKTRPLLTFRASTSQACVPVFGMLEIVIEVWLRPCRLSTCVAEAIKIISIHMFDLRRHCEERNFVTNGKLLTHYE